MPGALLAGDGGHSVRTAGPAPEPRWERSVFVAWRDLGFAKGRFALMGTVIVLITVLVGLLSGLTAGLGRENTSAITALPADHLVFPEPAEGGAVAFTDSRRCRSGPCASWARVPGVRRAEPLGIATTKAEAGGRTAAVSAFGVRPGSAAGTGGGRGRGRRGGALRDRPPRRSGYGPAVRSRWAAGRCGSRRCRARAMYSHTPVIWTSLGDGRKAAGGPGGPGGATVLALSTTGAADLAAADRSSARRRSPPRTPLRRSAPTAPRTARCS